MVCCWLTVLPHSTLPDFYIASLPSLVRFCRAFPPLCDDVVGLLLQLGRTVHAHLSTVNASCIGQSRFLYISDIFLSFLSQCMLITRRYHYSIFMALSRESVLPTFLKSLTSITKTQIVGTWATS